MERTRHEDYVVRRHDEQIDTRRHGEATGKYIRYSTALRAALCVIPAFFEARHGLSFPCPYNGPQGQRCSRLRSVSITRA